MSLKDRIIRTFWGNPFYRSILQPFDCYLVAPVPSRAFDCADVPLNKVCRVADATDPLWRRGYDDLGFTDDPRRFHRKVWEFNQSLYGLRRLRRLAPAATALGIGCGHEELMYFLANRIRHVTAPDLYEGAWIGGESDADVLTHPAKYAPFKYREDHLEVRRMDGLSLASPEAAFDFVFCLSSIEHFGRLQDKLRSLREMFRVLKPGGVAVLTTEVVLNRLGCGAQYFPAQTLFALVREAGFTLGGEPDLRVESEYAQAPLALPMDTFVSPHVVLRNFHTVYTSIGLFLMKPPGSNATCRALVGDEVVAPREPYSYAADLAVNGGCPRISPGESFVLSLSIRNTGDATWFSGTKSHNVRIGVSFVTREGRNLTGEPLRFELPGHVRPGERVSVVLSLVAPAGVAPATLKLHVGLVKELYFWFRDQGSPDHMIPLEAA